MDSSSKSLEKILIIDDQQIFRKKLALAVGTLGYSAVTASGGHEGITKLKEEDFDLVLLDIVMPDMDGFDVMQSM